MNCTVDVHYSENQQMITIPSSSIIFNKNKYWVMVFKNRHDIETREVEVELAARLFADYHPDDRSWRIAAGDYTVVLGQSATDAGARAALTLPAGEGFAWAAGEAASMVAVRQALVDGHGLDKSRVRASAYWKRGSAGHHETLGG